MALDICAYKNLKYNYGRVKAATIRTYTKLEQTCMIEIDLLQSYFISLLYRFSGSSPEASVTREASHPESFGPCHPDASGFR